MSNGCRRDCRPGIMRFLCGGFPFCGFQQIGPCEAACGDPYCDGCCDMCCDIYCGEAMEVCDLVHVSQTHCYARGRRAALHRLSNRYDCDEFPDVMTALLYGLNDCDEIVRRKAADEIGDQLRENPCCLNQCVVNALTASLCDCDRRVQREAAQALRVCGYTVSKPSCFETLLCGGEVCDTECCDPCCDTCCDSCCAMFNDNGDDWLQEPVHNDADDADMHDEDDATEQYNPAPVEDQPFVPPAPSSETAPEEVRLPATENNPAPTSYFPPTASRTAKPMGLRSSVQTTGWVR